jgi:DNA-binding MltR family transcriptional regulator
MNGNEYIAAEDDNPFWVTGKALERHFKQQEMLFEFSRLFEHESESDRSAVIVGAAFLDTLLEHILISFLVDDETEAKTLLRSDGPLGTYGNRARMAYCLGLIPKIVHNDLRLVGKIRNKFAHELRASFDSQDIGDWSTALQLHRTAYMTPPSGVSQRDLFFVGVNALVGYLDGMVGQARANKRKVISEG